MTPGMTDSQRYLAAYDEQLRTGAETSGALHVTTLGPLYLVTFPGDGGW